MTNDEADLVVAIKKVIELLKKCGPLYERELHRCSDEGLQDRFEYLLWLTEESCPK